MLRRLAGFLRQDQGSMTVEFVATVPLYLGVLVLMFEFGRGLWYHQIVTKGVRDGARYISREALTADSISAARNVALTGRPSGGTPHAFWTDPDTVTITSSAANPDGTTFRTPVNVVEVRAEVPIELSTLAFFNLDTSITMVVADRVRHIGD